MPLVVANEIRVTLSASLDKNKVASRRSPLICVCTSLLHCRLSKYFKSSAASTRFIKFRTHFHQLIFTGCTLTMASKGCHAILIVRKNATLLFHTSNLSKIAEEDALEFKYFEEHLKKLIFTESV